MNLATLYGEIARRATNPKADAAVVAEIIAIQFDILHETPALTAIEFVKTGLDGASVRAEMRQPQT